MNKNIALNQKALAAVIDDLVQAGLIKRSIRQHGATTPGIQSLSIDWSKEGTKTIARYAHAFGSIRNTNKRKREMFHCLLMEHALTYLERYGHGPDTDV